MKSAAIGLTCKDALFVFSQNETLAMQKRVTELERMLHRYVPMHANVVVDPSTILRQIRTVFDSKHSPATRDAPVAHKEHATTPLCAPHGIWSRFDSRVLETHNDCSLQRCIELVFVEAFGNRNATYCREQAYRAVGAAQHALLGGYMASQWTLFSVQQRQEYIVWQALFDHIMHMKRDFRVE